MNLCGIHMVCFTLLIPFYSTEHSHPFQNYGRTPGILSGIGRMDSCRLVERKEGTEVWCMKNLFGSAYLPLCVKFDNTVELVRCLWSSTIMEKESGPVGTAPKDDKLAFDGSHNYHQAAIAEMTTNEDRQNRMEYANLRPDALSTGSWIRSLGNHTTAGSNSTWVCCLNRQRKSALCCGNHSRPFKMDSATCIPY